MTRIVLLSLAVLAVLPPMAAADPPARLVGYYQTRVINDTVGGVRNEDFDGPHDGGPWRFTPICKRGACSVNWAEVGTVFRGSRSIEIKVEKARLTRSRQGGKDVYTGSYLEHCGKEEKPFRLSVTVTGSKLSKGKRIATRIRATVTHSEAFDNGPNGEVLYHDEVFTLTGRSTASFTGGTNGQCVSRGV